MSSSNLSARPAVRSARPLSAALSRRGLLRGGLGAVAGVGLAGGLAGCGSAFTAGIAGTKLDPGTVTYWNLFGGGDGGRMVMMEDGYAKAHGGSSSLEAATFAWGNPYYTKLSLATLGGKPPDVAISHLTRAKNLANAGLLTEITPAMLSSVGLKVADFNPSTWQAGLISGRSYDIPLDTHPLVLFYNTTVCKKAGLLDSDGLLKPIQGTEEWEAALTAAKKVTGKYGVTMANVNETATPWRVFQTLYSQMNGATPFLSDDGTKLTFDEDLAIKTLTYIQHLVKSGWMPAQESYAGAETDMFEGQSAFYLEGEWELTTAQTFELTDKSFGFSMAPVPQLFDKPAAQADSHTFVLPTKDRDAAQLSLALNFIKSLLSQSDIWAQGGHIPAYLPYKESAAYQKLEPQAQYAAAPGYAVYDSPAWYSGSGSDFENVVGAEIGLVQAGLASPKAGLANIVSQLKTYSTTANPI
jgi:multiple sugar transport system substrate-binding protein